MNGYYFNENLKSGTTINHICKIDCDNNLIISYDDNIKDVKIICDNTIMLKNRDGFCSLYDMNKGYLIKFEDNVKFDMNIDENTGFKKNTDYSVFFLFF